ncbi:MAG: DUF1553 domain-containing protein [Planctomycetes bacterium]|nr:DUF1553 domain-containing protein [Planctomycetota bacterium]MCC7172014.1 DUF1553 domain-containing protein [Planctomycetota bacterium]
MSLIATRPSPRARSSVVVAVAILWIGGSWHAASSAPERAARTVDFFKEVRPILAQHCFTCHGPDAERRKGDLRLDVHEDAFARMAEGGAPFVPGDPAASHVLLRIKSTDPDERMPKGADALTERQIETIERWIEQGATWREHWAFTAPTKHELPAVADANWARDPLDRFVLARLEQDGWKPEPEATREQWLRRVTFDLTGLPPTPDELDQFTKDTSADAYEKAVDRLLASPRYGERQAQEWLDLARYADTSGYQRDEGRENWKWREWVIHAFNANMPFDRFGIEQLAGDLLEHPTLEQRIATGFSRNHPTNSEAGEEEDEYRSAYVMDRLHTTSTAFMGLTLACAQCHDHKYDPLSQKDFYSFYAFFDQVAERDSDGFGAKNSRPSLPVPSPDQAPRLADLTARIDALKQRLEADDPLTDAAQAQWEARQRAALATPFTWETLDPAGLLSRNGSKLERQPDGSILSSGPSPVRDTYDLVFQPGKRTIQALRIEVVPDPSLPGGKSGRADDGRFILTRLELRNSTLSESKDPPLVHLAIAQADLRQERDPDASFLEATPGDIDTAIAVDEAEVDGGDGPRSFGAGWCVVGDAMSETRAAVLIPLEPLELNEAAVLRMALHHTSQSKYKALIGRFRISVTSDPRIRERLLPVTAKPWSTLGPFSAEHAPAAFETAYAPEQAIKGGVDLRKTFDPPAPAEPDGDPKKPGGKNAPGPTDDATKTAPKAQDGKPAADAPASPTPAEPVAAAQPASTPTAGAARAAAPSEVSVDGAKGTAATAAAPTAAAAKLEAANEPDPSPKPRKSAGAEAVPAATKPAAKDAADAPAAAENSNDPLGGDATKRRKKDDKLTWQEQKTWRDGATQTLRGASGDVAYYLTRKLVADRARTVVLRLDGPAGVKVWLNGELVFSEAPANPVPESKSANKGDAKPKDDDGEFDFGDGFFRRERPKRTARIGIRAGENELVVKAIYALPKPKRGEGGPGATGAMGGMGEMPGMGGGFGRFGGGGASFTSAVSAEGDDVLDFEVATLLAEPPPATPPVVTPPQLPKPVAIVADTSAKPPVTREQRGARTIRAWYRRHIDPIGRVLAVELDRLEAERDDVMRTVPETMVMEERREPRKTYVFKRGQYKNKGTEVSADVPSILPPLAKDLPRNRLGLARWLFAPEHPLTARVAVNRIWAQYFGVGLVKTGDDFGVRSELPSHPELLDTLAVEFRESGWDMKALHRRIVLSATYRQSALIASDKLAKDPENSLLARGPRLRLAAEMVRDNALYAAGLLVESIGGKSVKPYQPEGLWKAVTGGRDWKRDAGEEQYRRGIYVYWKRGVPYPSLLTFDASKRETCTVSRPQTTTPLQSLVLLNDPVYVEAARVFAQRLLKEGGKDDGKRIALGFRWCTSRVPDAEEVAVLTKLLAAQREHYAADPAAAKKLLAVGDAKPDAKLDAAELAAWTGVAQALLNLDATIHRG